MEPSQELTVGQKLKLGVQAAGAFARNPKALVALVKYQVAQRRQAKANPVAPEADTTEA
jgi:hypothetical protein